MTATLIQNRKCIWVSFITRQSRMIFQQDVQLYLSINIKYVFVKNYIYYSNTMFYYIAIFTGISTMNYLARKQVGQTLILSSYSQQILFLCIKTQIILYFAFFELKYVLAILITTRPIAMNSLYPKYVDQTLLSLSYSQQIWIYAGIYHFWRSF